MSNRTTLKLLTVCAALLPTLALAERAPVSVGSVLAHHLEARGGEARLRALQSVEVSAVSFEEGGTTPLTLTLSRPHRVQTEVRHAGGRATAAYEGSGGWSSQACEVHVRADGARRAMTLEGAQFDEVLLDPAAHGVTVALAGEEEVQGAPAWRLELTHRDWAETRLIDQASGLEVRRIFRATHGGEAHVRTLSFSGYRQVRGVRVAAVTEWETAGARGRTVLRSVRFNVPADAAPPDRVARRR